MSKDRSDAELLGNMSMNITVKFIALVFKIWFDKSNAKIAFLQYFADMDLVCLTY